MKNRPAVRGRYILNHFSGNHPSVVVEVLALSHNDKCALIREEHSNYVHQVVVDVYDWENIPAVKPIAR